jgi:Ras-related protein Rab-2A
MSIQFHYLLKYIIIGNSSVGKSNLLLKFAHNKFLDEYQATIGVEFGAKNVEIDNKIFRIQIWDTAGQENFRSITRAYYKNSVCALIVYDINNEDTFDSVQSWIQECKLQTPKTVTMVLVGNKCDLECKVDRNKAKELAEENKMLYFETSAKTGKGVDELFKKSAAKIKDNIEKNYYDLTNESCGVKIGNLLYDVQIKKNKKLQKGDVEKKKNCC